MEIIEKILRENRRRRESRRFDPMTGENSPGKRLRVNMECPVLGTRPFWLPATMAKTIVGRAVINSGTLTAFAKERGLSAEKIGEMFELVRLLHDFPYWAAKYGLIRPKRGGENTPLILNSAQRKLIGELERIRTSGAPIRVILLKARQWGGSTAIQLYMVWIQLVRNIGMNSLIVAHQNVATEDIRAMMKRVVDSYPEHLLRADFEAAERGLLEERAEIPVKRPTKMRNGDRDEEDRAKERKSPLKAVGRSGNTWHLPERNCDFRIGTAERPDSSRGGSYSLVHLSEVGIWRATDGKSPSEIVISATSGVLAEPETMIVLESTAKGTGNYFHREYAAASEGEAQWTPVFISWFDIEQYELPVPDPETFAAMLLENKEDTDASDRAESGRYLWRLWESGATLEAINWYMWERRKYDSSQAMSSEYPSDDMEAFAASGNRIFSNSLILGMEKRCREADVSAIGGAELRIWTPPVRGNEYLVIFRPGTPEKGERATAVVLDVTESGRPRVVAEIAGRTGTDGGAEAVGAICSRYDGCMLAVTADRGDDVGCGHALYSARMMAEKGILLCRPSRGETIWRLNGEIRTAAADVLRTLMLSGRWDEPGAEALAQMETLEADPTEGFRPVWGNSDDLVTPRALGVFIDAMQAF